MKIVIIFFIVFISYTRAQLISCSAGCPVVTPVQNFDAAKYLGLWYELYRYENAAQVSGDCVTQQLSLNSDGTIRVFNTQEYLVNGTSRSIQGTAKYFDATIQPPQASLSVSFFSFAPSYPNYNVLATDYQNYSIVYSCESAFNNKASSISVFILARQPAVNVTIIYEIIVQILRFNIDARNLRFTVQNPKLCSYPGVPKTTAA